jgi:hypothetical protein
MVAAVQVRCGDGRGGEGGAGGADGGDIFLSRERCVPYAFDVQQIFGARIKRWKKGVKLMGLALGSILGSNHQR